MAGPIPMSTNMPRNDMMIVATVIEPKTAGDIFLASIAVIPKDIITPEYFATAIQKTPLNISDFIDDIFLSATIL